MGDQLGGVVRIKEVVLAIVKLLKGLYLIRFGNGPFYPEPREMYRELHVSDVGPSIEAGTSHTIKGNLT